MFLPHYDVYRVSIAEQTTARCNLFVLYKKNVKIFAKISFVVRRKDFSTPFDAIIIYTKQSTSLVVDNSKIAVMLVVEMASACVCPLIDHSSRPMIF